MTGVGPAVLESSWWQFDGACGVCEKSESLTVDGIIRIAPEFVSVRAFACAGFRHIPHVGSDMLVEPAAGPESLCVRGAVEIWSGTEHQISVIPIHSGWTIVWRMGRRDRRA